MSDLGHKRKSKKPILMSALPPKADINSHTLERLLCARKRHSDLVNLFGK